MDIFFVYLIVATLVLYALVGHLFCQWAIIHYQELRQGESPHWLCRVLTVVFMPVIGIHMLVSASWQALMQLKRGSR